MTRIHQAILQAAPELRKWRHHLHCHPELGFEETKTARFLADKLKSFGVKVETEVGLTGLVATIQGRRPLSGAKPRSVGLRADMDALPMQEAQHGREYESRTPGIFHGCGHDGHMTMLLAAARQLAGAPDFAGTVHCIFQPAEEGRGGALKMIEDGLFERFPCDEIYAMHNWPGMPAGRIDAQPGPRMASSDNFDITLTSRGGHAAMPHLCTDAILVGSHIVTALQTIPSRLVDPVDPVVLSVTQMRAGTEAYNVIPSTCHLAGTLRAFSPEVRRNVPGMVAKLVRTVAAAWDVDAHVEWNAKASNPLRSEVGYPPTVNTPKQARLALQAAVKTVGADMVSDTAKASMGAEDFSVMLEKVPGAYVWLGAGEACPPLHHASFDFNDALLPIGAQLFVNMALESLQE